MKLEAITAPSDFVPDSYGRNLYEVDPQFAALLKLYLPNDLYAHLQPHLTRLGGLAGGMLDELAGTADKNPPTLRYRTRNGADRQSLVKHPAYQELERFAYSEYGLAALSHRRGVLGWDAPLPPSGEVRADVSVRAGRVRPLLSGQHDRLPDPNAAQVWLSGSPRTLSPRVDEPGHGHAFARRDVHDRTWCGIRRGRDRDDRPPSCRRQLAPLRRQVVLLEPRRGSRDGARAAGRRAPGTKGLALFLLPRELPDGSSNSYRILRLKEKLGTRSMASGEIRLEGATAYLVGELGRGFVQMTDMINNSRLSNGVRAAGLMRRALNEALFVATRAPRVWQASDRASAYAAPAREDDGVDRAGAHDDAADGRALGAADQGDASARQLVRILTPLIKFRACRDARKVTGDAMEVRGGCGYIEEWAEPRLLRDAHLGSIWEGTSNIVSLDVLRSIRKADTLAALTAHWRRQLDEASLDPALRARFDDALRRTTEFASQAAASTQDIFARQAASALYHATTAVAMAWEAKRIGDARRLVLANMVLTHRLAARDPLSAATEPPELLTALLSEQPLRDADIARALC